MAAYCKLIVYNVAPLRRAAEVFKHYIRVGTGTGAPRRVPSTLMTGRRLQCYNDYGDIIKATLSKAREINKLGCALTMQLAMQMLFTDVLRLHPRPSRQLTEFLEVKELAKRFAVMFGLDAVKNREALTALHRAGVAFAALEGPGPGPPPNLLFLEPLAEFSAKLLRQDKRAVLKVRVRSLGPGMPRATVSSRPCSVRRDQVLEHAVGRRVGAAARLQELAAHGRPGREAAARQETLHETHA